MSNSQAIKRQRNTFNQKLEALGEELGSESPHVDVVGQILNDASRCVQKVEELSGEHPQSYIGYVRVIAEISNARENVDTRAVQELRETLEQRMFDLNEKQLE